jgi:4-amino-4-deoxy-L-arabinose transferase-like glycosyltransferase
MPPDAERTRPRLSDLLILLAAALAVRTVAALLVGYPPYTDPAYYAMIAERLATGHGFSAPVIWSFLEVGGALPADPVLPVPSNGHWMPLTSIVAAGSMLLFGANPAVGQIPMIGLSALLVPFTYLIGVELWNSRSVGLGAAVLALFAGPLFLMYPTVDNFAVFGTAGAAALYAATRAVRSPRPLRWLVVSGAAVGLASLARVDGLLLVVAPVLAAWLTRRNALGRAAAAVATAALVMAPWLIRNLQVFGSALPSAGGHTLWITEYNQQFSISTQPTLQSYLEWGWMNIIGSKLVAWVEISGRTALLMGGIFGLFFVAGLWFNRRRPEIAPFTAYFVVMFVAMGAIFTFHAPKGAFFHSAPAWLPFALPMAVAAVGPSCTAVGRWWRFLARPATHRFVLVVGLVGAIGLSVFSSVSLWRIWDVARQRDVAAGQFFIAGGHTDDVVLYADTPSLWQASANPAVATPYDPYPVIEQVARAYGGRWLVVALRGDATIDPLGLWNGPDAVDGDGNPADWLASEPSFEADGVRIWRILDPAEMAATP